MRAAEAAPGAVVCAAELLGNRLRVLGEDGLRVLPALHEHVVAEAEERRNVEAVRARHAVGARGARDVAALQVLERRPLERGELLLGARPEVLECRDVLLDVLGARHAGEDRHHVGEARAEPERPFRKRRLGVERDEVPRQRLVVPRERAAEKRLHYDHGYLVLRQRLVEVFPVEVPRVDLLRVAPVDVVHLYLAEVPLVVAVVLYAPLERLRVAVEGEAEVAYALFAAKLSAPVKRAVLEIPLRERRETVVPDRMKEVVVDVVGAEEPEGVLEHLPARVERILTWREVRELRRDDVVLPREAALRERFAEAALGLAAAVRGRRVEVVDAVLEQIADLPVEHLLVYRRLGVAAFRPAVRMAAVDGGKAHGPVSQDRHLPSVRLHPAEHRLRTSRG